MKTYIDKVNHRILIFVAKKKKKKAGWKWIWMSCLTAKETKYIKCMAMWIPEHH